MHSVKRRFSTDLLGTIAVLCIAVLVVILIYVAAANPSTRQLLSVVITGLGAGGLILFRQLRKSAQSLIASEARAQHAASHDERTQLPNRMLFLERLTAAAQVSQADAERPLAVMCIGFDRFEEVSEVLGLSASEDVVVEIAGRLISVCGERDTVARLSDGTFGMLWSGATRGKVDAVAAQIVKLLATPCAAAGGQAFITCSIGVSCITAELETPLEALRQAQLALSGAKRLGGGQYRFFEPAMDFALKHRKLLEVDLRRALAEGELSMVYQPQVDTKGALIGVEALMRWQSPERGPVSPAAFVPLAESCGLSDAVGRFAMRQALVDSRKWPGLKVAVNVSAAQVRAGGLVGMLKEALADSGVSPKNIELEITEGLLLSDGEETFDVLNACRRLGFSLVLDDFGTGYSSLSYLRRFPIDKIKIDRSFVSHLGMRPESSAIVKAIVDLAQALELKVLAEGVETRAQVDRLIQIGCPHFQGYYYSPPVPADVVDEMLSGKDRLAA